MVGEYICFLLLIINCQDVQVDFSSYTFIYCIQFQMDCGQLRVSLINVAVFPAIQYLWQRLACWNNR